MYDDNIAAVDIRNNIDQVIQFLRICLLGASQFFPIFVRFSKKHFLLCKIA